jgi:hypothetical protein
MAYMHLVPVLGMCLSPACSAHILRGGTGTACPFMCQTALNALCCAHVPNVKCCAVLIFQSHVTCHTFSSFSVMLSREIFLKTTSLPSLRLYNSAVLKGRKLLFLSQVSFYKVNCVECFVTILHAFPPSSSAFSLFSESFPSEFCLLFDPLQVLCWTTRGAFSPGI